jgi:hypothetical protein
LAQKFRIYNSQIQAKPENVDCIILSTCILHNFIKKYNPNMFTCKRTTTNTNGTTEDTRLENMPMQDGNATRDAFRERELLKDYFSSESGSVPWQDERMNE